MNRKFEERFNKAVHRLVKLELLTWRNMRTPEGPAKYAQGYKAHKKRGKDAFLTERGLFEAEDRLRERGLMALELARCDEVPEPSGPKADGRSGCDD